MCAAEMEIKPTTPRDTSSRNDNVSPDEDHMMASKSLMEEEEEDDDDDEEQQPISRNPSLEDEGEDHGGFFPRASDWEGIANPINCSQVVFPVCQGQLAEHIEHITVRILV
jgi:hypothetical protein